MELMTNRQLSQLCAKGLCEWCYKEEQKVRSNYEYLCSESDVSISNQIIIRPFEKSYIYRCRRKYLVYTNRRGF